VTIKVRYHDFTTITRATRSPRHATKRTSSAARFALLDKTDAAAAGSIAGVSVHNLSEIRRSPENPQASLPFDLMPGP